MELCFLLLIVYGILLYSYIIGEHSQSHYQLLIITQSLFLESKLVPTFYL